MSRETSPRRRGRPKTTGASENAEELRREQIRSAQRAYRLRRDNRIRAMEEAHVELEARCELMKKTLLEIREEAERNMSCEPLAGMILRRTAQFFDGTSPERIASPSGERPTQAQALPGSEAQHERPRNAEQTFGYLVSDMHSPPSHTPSGSPSPRASSPSLPPSISPPTSYTHQETTFARRLHRKTLEHAYETFTSFSPSPQSVYRTFRLVPCFQDRAKMRPYFLGLLRSDAGQRLELYGLPFYCVGGAGKHYPRADGDVMNLRFPKRILGIGEAGGGEGYEERLRVMGYGGVWFDSYEVECYLRERGICPQANSSIVPVGQASPASLGEPGGIRPQIELPSARSENTEVALDRDHQSGSDVTDSPTTTTGRYFDVDDFLECICSTASILGRAPGFRKDCVDAAIRHALRRA
ncbi:uncharacterized protein DNG_00734 [Cephalotrichum gorgonifer]|uniref:BZIP domain-containing protein n=1 Tax=Cephalotrichum gorgonifer TaxID=2041049 RepID=A0AAE8MPU0_9PEZI|nr:uncharacterized protein DNG_00734 [Cephalotrichum gorgonifer]